MKKIKFIILNLFLTILILEVLLRIYGFIYVYRVSKLYKSKKSSYRLKILAVGESSTGGLWIEDKSYPLQLEKKLNNYLHCDSCIKVDIMSLAGANSSMNLYFLPSFLFEKKPDIVVFMTGFNDRFFFTYNLDALILEKFYFKNKFIYKIYLNTIKILNELRTVRILKLIYSNTFLINTKTTNLEARFTESLYKQREDFLSQNIEFVNSSTRLNIEKMISIVEKNKIKPVLMTYHMGWVNDIIRDIAKEKNIPLIDNEAFFKTKPIAEYVFAKDAWHPNEKGYELIAQNVLNFLIVNKLILKK